MQIRPEIIVTSEPSTSAEQIKEKGQPNGPEFEEIQTQHRRSTRIPKLSAKALYMLQYDDPNFQDTI